MNRDQRAVLDTRLARMVGLVAEHADLVALALEVSRRENNK